MQHTIDKKLIRCLFSKKTMLLQVANSELFVSVTVNRTVGYFVFEYLNLMKQFLNKKDFFINPQRVREFD